MQRNEAVLTVLRRRGARHVSRMRAAYLVLRMVRRWLHVIATALLLSIDWFPPELGLISLSFG